MTKINISTNIFLRESKQISINYYHQEHILLAIIRLLINETKEYTNLIVSDYISSAFFIFKPAISDFCFTDLFFI